MISIDGSFSTDSLIRSFHDYFLHREDIRTYHFFGIKEKVTTFVQVDKNRIQQEKFSNMPAPNNKPKIAKKSTPTKHSRSSAGGGPPADKRLLSCTLSMEQASGSPDASREKVGALAGVKSSTLAVVLSKLKKQGLIEYTPTTIRLTPEGKTMADPGIAPMDNAAVQQDLKEKFALKGKAACMFDAMLDGKVYDRAALAAQVGITNKATLAVMVSNMKKKGAVDTPDSKTIQLSDLCFPLGRPCEASDV